MKQQILGSSGEKANVFQNEDAVSNQVGIQNISGSVFYHTTHVDGGGRSTFASIDECKRREQYRNSLRFDQIEARITTIKPAHLKTCRWLLTQPAYIAWSQDSKLSEHHGLMWIKGKPATGKSTMMKFALLNTQKNEADTITLAFFFNARGEELEKSTTGMYRSLLFQLLCNHPELLSIFDTFRQGKDNMDSADWDNGTLMDLFSKVIMQLSGRRITCFIDALDECDETQIREMISFFEYLGMSQPDTPFRICFSSRHYPHITVSHGVSLIIEEQMEHEHDIKEYLQTELKIGSSIAATQIKNELLKRASGIFLWIVLTTRILNREYDRGQMIALRSRLNTIPDDLGALFHDIMTREGIPRPRLILCIQWVLFARIPLKAEELYFAIISGTDPKSISSWNKDELSLEDIQRYILNCSQGLVEQTRSERPTIQFIHESVRDYFLNGDGLQNHHLGSIRWFTADSHDQLKHCCEKYYSEASFQSNLVLRHLESDVNNHNWLRDKTKAMFPLARYAVGNIFYHCEMAHQHGHDQVNFLEKFELAFWVKLRNLLLATPRPHFGPIPSDVSLLYVLALEGSSNLLRLVYGRNQTIITNLISSDPSSLIKAALQRGHASAVQVLLSARNEDVQNSFIDTWPIYLDDDDVSAAVSELLEIRLHTINWPIFILAAQKGFVSTIRCMIRSDWHGESCDKESALRIASASGAAYVVPVLIDAGAEVNAQGGYFGNALQAASACANAKIVQMLIEAGAEINMQGGYFGNALQAASSRDNNEKVVQMLIDAGADINAQGGFYGQALQGASHFGSERVVQILINAGAKVNAQGGFYGNALQAAAASNVEKLVRILIDAGAEVNAQGGCLCNALQTASARGNEKMVQMLIDAGAEVNIQGGHFGSALRASLLCGNKNTTQMLINAGAKK